MGLVSGAARALGRGGRSISRKAVKTGEGLNAIANYLMITGGLGGAAGGLMGAYSEQEAGGDPNEGAIGGARAGAMMGPATLGPAAALSLGTGPVGPFAGTTALLPYLLNVQSGSSEKRLERERQQQEEEVVRQAIMMRLMQDHQR